MATKSKMNALGIIWRKQDNKKPPLPQPVSASESSDSLASLSSYSSTQSSLKSAGSSADTTATPAGPASPVWQASDYIESLPERPARTPPPLPLRHPDRTPVAEQDQPTLTPSLPSHSSIATTPSLRPKKASATWPLAKEPTLTPSGPSSSSISTSDLRSRKAGSASTGSISSLPEGQVPYTPSLRSRTIPPDTEKDTLKHIDQILGDISRAEAETFVRKSSLTPRVGWSSPRKPSGAWFGSATLCSPQPREQPQIQNDIERSSAPGGRIFRAATYSGPETPVTVRGTSDNHFRSLSTGLSPTSQYDTPTPPASHSFTSSNNRVIKKFPGLPNIAKRIRLPSQIFPFFTNREEAEIEKKVFAEGKTYSCEKHENCTDCLNTEFAYWENLKMSTSIPADERQKIITNNKSLRTIKNELDNLLSNGMINDDIYGTIIDSLPSETSLNSAARRNVTQPTPTQDSNSLHTAIDNMRLNNNSSASSQPPAYSSSNGGPPALPGRAPSQSQPERPEIGRAVSLYAYSGAPDDCAFGVGETIVVYEYMNAEWCYGKNVNTGRQGLFPANYVQFSAQNAPTPNPNAYGAYGNEKQGAYGGGYQGQYQQQGPPPPGPSNPYNSAVPPMAVAEQPVDGKPGKGAEMGKKFGKKLGNAAIFGAGATIGGNIVNSIF